ncbi:hypothetical protein BDF14DRAFT_786862 [Spinellus fusiger]|nr:hypothetical protein BDF14DRAFT_786862 [Spinellus fusiger]
MFVLLFYCLFFFGSPSQCCLFQPEYWQLLTQLLQHYDTRATVNPTKSPPVIRAYLVMTLGTVLQKLYTTFLEDSEKRTLVLEELHTCTRLLFSTNYTYSYRPTLEHMTVAADQVTTALGLQLHHTHKKEERAIEALAGLAQIIYARYDSQLVQAANQKKAGASL